LSKITAQDIHGWQIVILGEGDLRRSVEQVVWERGLRSNVLLVPNIPYVEMPLVYASANLFMLPSLADRNPLSVVEALHSGLPLLVSNRIGNLPEVLTEPPNGWALDPADPNSVRAAVSAAFSSSPEQLRQMGRLSKETAVTFWHSQKAIDKFLDALPV
jgi:glycosyltransferase involved in cell wall biosynthesis